MRTGLRSSVEDVEHAMVGDARRRLVAHARNPFAEPVAVADRAAGIFGRLGIDKLGKGRGRRRTTAGMVLGRDGAGRHCRDTLDLLLFGLPLEGWPTVSIVRWCGVRKCLLHQEVLAPRPGLEPGTCGLTVRRSTD